MRKSMQILISLLVFLVTIAGCATLQPQQPAALSTTTAILTSTPTAPPTATRRPTRTPPPTFTPEPAIPTALPASALCAPLEDIPYAEMTEILQVPMQTPRPGQDDGHHGSDFAFYRFGHRANMEGLDIFSVLDGVVASNVVNRKPYGNMIMIETPLNQLSADILQALNIPQPAVAIAPDSRMAACSPGVPSLNLDPANRSLYVLYGHLLSPSTLQPGEHASCGQKIGEVGNTGMSGNPHLHLELRVGPSGARFPSMAYYDTGATQDEYDAYCTWRVSQIFQIIEPMLLIQAGAAR